MTQDSVDKRAEDLLKGAKGRRTRQRREVLTAILEQDGPVTHSSLQGQLPLHDRVSLYRTLDWLTEEKIIEPLPTNDGIRRYALCDTIGLHPQFICERCGNTQVLKDVSIPTQSLPQDYTITRVTTVISGTCSKCQSA